MKLRSRIVKAIGRQVKEGFSDSYIEAYAWSLRDNDTSMDDIKTVIEVFRLYFTEPLKWEEE